MFSNMCALYVYLYMVSYKHLLIYSNIHENIYIVKEVIKDIINFKNENNSEMVFVIYFNFVLWKFCAMYFEHIHNQLLPFSSSFYHFFPLNFETTSLCLEVFFVVVVLLQVPFVRSRWSQYWGLLWCVVWLFVMENFKSF